MIAALRVALVALFLAGAGAAAVAQSLTALARFDPAASRIAGQGAGVTLSLALGQTVPWRVRLADNPPRLIIDTREVDWSGIEQIPETSDAVVALRAGVFRAGWSRLVLVLSGPFTITSAEMQSDLLADAGVRIALRLDPATPAAFAQAANLPEPAEWALPEPAQIPAAPVQTGGALRVVLDPGHGGIDPGAESEGQTEAGLMLVFARELKERLLREGGFSVTLTRDDDVFIPLEARISVARAAQAQVFVSLHADALATGEATGATVYLLSDEASDEASRTLAERHDRDDLLAGVDLTQQDDLVATILMDMARTDTTPRTARLASALAAAIQGAGIRMHRHPVQRAGFSVLKSPDIPSVLLELGFLSASADLKRLRDPVWRGQMQGAIVQGLREWHAADQAARATVLPALP